MIPLARRNDINQAVICCTVRVQGYTERGVTCWSGNDDEAHAARHDAGAAGVISVTSNLIPGLFRSLMQTRDDALMERCASAPPVPQQDRLLT